MGLVINEKWSTTECEDHFLYTFLHPKFRTTSGWPRDQDQYYTGSVLRIMRAIKYRIPKGYHTSNETLLSLLQTFNKSHLSFNYSHYTDQFKAENSFFFCKRIEKDIMSKIKSVSNSKRIEFMYSSNFKNKHDTFKSNMERKKT